MKKRLLNISEASSIAMHTLVFMASDEERYFSIHNIAKVIGVSENHLSKVLQRLAKVGLVKSLRGPSGGFKLAKSPESITLMDAYEAVEGPFVPITCILDRKTCCGDECFLGDVLSVVNEKFEKHMKGTNIAQFKHLYSCKREES